MRVVLVVEDDPISRARAVEALEEAGHIVVDFATAGQAIAFCAVEANDVGAVLADINMPGDQDGLDLARYIAETRPDARIVVTSGLVDCLSAGIPSGVIVLGKPWSLDAMMRAIGDPEL